MMSVKGQVKMTAGGRPSFCMNKVLKRWGKIFTREKYVEIAPSLEPRQEPRLAAGRLGEGGADGGGE